jgi:hypothetical protein
VPDPKNTEDSTLPRPELNPLLNPLLASHMGRWAEVYFTNPPEKREEAVLELLRELEGTPGAIVDPVRTPPEENHAEKNHEETKPQEIRITEAVPPPPLPVDEPSVCNECGYLSRPGQRFCGMCGTPLIAETTASLETGQPQEVETSSFTLPPEFAFLAAGQAVRGEESSREESSKKDARPQKALPSHDEPFQEQRQEETAFSPAPSLIVDPVPARREPTWPKSKPELRSLSFQPEPTPDRRRFYVAIVIAALLSILLYLGWHTGQSSGPGAQEVNLPSSPAAEMPRQQAAAAPPASTPDPAENGHVDKTANNSTENEDTRQVLASPSARRRRVASRKAEPAPPVTAPAPSSAEGGAEELAMAQKYLYGNGEPRDSAEAVRWLWKAIGKQNMTATILLSDLYLRGEGVPHSCDQARLLLDAAARKGKAEAAERLQHMQAFGCQ